MSVIGVQTGRKTFLVNYYLFQLSVHIFCNNVMMTNRNVKALIVEVFCEKLALRLKKGAFASTRPVFVRRYSFWKNAI